MTWWGRGIGGTLVLALTVSTLGAETPSRQRKEPDKPTTVTADHLEVRLKEHRAIYTGNVELKTPDLAIRADRMEFDFNEKMEAVEHMLAIGNVRISHREGYTAVSERATYSVLEDKVVLEGHARASRGENMVTGTRITLFMKEDRQVVEGDEGERVTAVIHPKQQPGPAR